MLTDRSEGVFCRILGGIRPTADGDRAFYRTPGLAVCGAGDWDRLALCVVRVRHLRNMTWLAVVVAFVIAVFVGAAFEG